MCGIIGRISVKINSSKTLSGLKELEYRGYDSFGVLLYNKDTHSHIYEKDVGEFDVKKYPHLLDFPSHIEIGHTRWATHGGVTNYNAHPHFDMDKKFFVVMNGIVENFFEVREELSKDGFKFLSQTDTEVIPMLYAKYFEEGKDVLKSLIDATKKVIDELRGEFSYLLKFENYVIGYKNINPIIVGENEKEIFISSDSNLVQKYTNYYYILEDEEMFVAEIQDSNFRLSFFDKDFKVMSKDKVKSIYLNRDSKKENKYYMEDEILEQKYLRNFLSVENLDSLKYLLEKSKRKSIVLTGAGTSFHAALSMHYSLLNMGILSECRLASELKNYSNLTKNSLIVVFSQSGETADLIYPLKELKKDNEVFTITNTPNSTLDRFAKRSVYLNCGKEVAVASTKAFVFQIFIAKVLHSLKNNYDLDITLGIFEDDFVRVLQDNKMVIDDVAELLCYSKNFFFIGRDRFYPLALEGALKLKEISYINAQGFPGGELKHGSLALIENGVPIVVLDDSDEIISNATEIKTRGGLIIGISEKNKSVFDYHIKVPSNYKKIFSTIMMQLLAFEITLKLGLNPDKPRNLAKSVTVK